MIQKISEPKKLEYKTMPEASEREPSNNYKVCIVTTTAKLKNVGRGGGRLGVWEGFLVGLEK